MAVAVQLDFKGATIDQYDRVMGVMGFQSGGQGPPGLLFHWVAPTDDGMCVTDVWKDRQTFDRFSEEHIGPSMAQAGVDIQPEVTFHEVHNYLIAG